MAPLSHPGNGHSHKQNSLTRRVSFEQKTSQPKQEIHVINFHLQRGEGEEGNSLDSIHLSTINQPLPP